MHNHHFLSPRSFFFARKRLNWLMKTQSHEVAPHTWQGMPATSPDMVSHELMNVAISIDLDGQEGLDHWRKDTQPNLPWADDHFEERVCGAPINPGREWQNWPWGKNAANFLDEQGMFNHNYMERYWPKEAGNIIRPTQDAGDYWAVTRELSQLPSWSMRYGIRNEYGDLHDLVASLAGDPETRQAWFPVFHPEDVGYVVGGRKPCSLGYQFIRREDKLNVYYPLRSCDLVRHWADDCYLTIRLLLWVLEGCKTINPDAWRYVTVGNFMMHCTSLHVFANDMRSL